MPTPKNIPPPPPDRAERMLKFFACEHLPTSASRKVAEEFRALARIIDARIKQGPERTVTLRKLLEARDAAVRATLNPGG